MPLPAIDNLEKKAVKAASSKKWARAVRINLSILKLQPENIAALNRLAWAYIDLGKVQFAQSTYKKVIALDKYNLIANKNLKRLAASPVKDKKINSCSSSVKKTTFLFLEEPGKTKVVSLVRLAPPKILSSLRCADPVELMPKKRQISVKDLSERYLGTLPDDLSYRLIAFFKAGNLYQAWIKAVDEQNLQIFIREKKRGQKFAKIPSFGYSDRNYLSGQKFIPSR